MKPYIAYTKEQLQAELKNLAQTFEQLKGKGLALNMSRGKPAKAQIDAVRSAGAALPAPRDPCH